jgi:hypothetical protein
MKKEELELSINTLQAGLFITLLTEKMRHFEVEWAAAKLAAESALLQLEEYKKKHDIPDNLDEKSLGKSISQLIGNTSITDKDKIREFLEGADNDDND